MPSISPKLALLALPITALWAYRDGPPPNMTGGLGGQTCHICHSDGPLNEVGGSLALRGIPDRYEPGATYPIVVSLTREGMTVGGFQLTARFADGKPAGLWSVEGDRARVTPGGFVQHTKEGARVSATSASEWHTTWTAPERGEVVFHAAANASNDDASALGDAIYTAEARSGER